MLRVVRVAGRSMAPTLRPSDLLVTARVGRAGVGRGDVVVFRHDGVRMVKRVAAVAGDRVTLEAGRLGVEAGSGARADRLPVRAAAVPGAALGATAVGATAVGATPVGAAAVRAVRGAAVRTWQVPHGTVFVVGDDPGRSTDSRVWVEPFVSLADVEARVLCRLGRRRARRRAGRRAHRRAPAGA